MLILASASPRRHELLVAAGIEHIVQPTNVPESPLPHEPPEALVQRLAREKTAPILPGINDIILGADTVVCVDNQIFAKPLDAHDAERMLTLLAGRAHWVHTGICLRSSTQSLCDLSSTEVFFLPLTRSVIREYTRSGEFQGKAGAYAIQGLASRFVDRIQGSYHNVVGLPVSLVYRHLQTFPNHAARSS